ncbi:MAG: galactose mutarotase [Dysgonamonadaceae bacterium]|jgi:aldose 1-epimerase|nr:galactose mutarotase [Dysgonamonadaceae bacterium]
MDNETTLGGLKRADFRQTVDGKPVDLYILRNPNGLEAAITNYGAKVVSLHVPDKNGNPTDVVLGHDSIDAYLKSAEPYFGAVCGRTANRIAKGQFFLEDKLYRLAINNGPNNLHGGIKGFNAVVWDVEQPDGQTLVLTYLSKDGEEGFPGNLATTVTYQLVENALVITFKATVDRTTVLNLTNHSFFNLSGAGDPSILDHELEINADFYLPTDETSIPYGKPERVADTPMDFRTPFAVGARIEADFQPLIYGKGYDHTYVLNKKGNELSFCARCYAPKTGIVMETLTTEPGVQLYTGNYLSGDYVGKYGKTYPMRSALCLETQHFPNSPNEPSYPTTVLQPEETFFSKTVFQFKKL